MADNKLSKIVALCKRRGFVYPGSDIYGGLANSYAYGPLGTELLRNIKNHWWENFVKNRQEIYGLETNIIMHPNVWKASGHVDSFTDVMVECKGCNNRFRADHLIFKATGENVEGKQIKDLEKIIKEKEISCPNCGAKEFSRPKEFNILFVSSLGSVPKESSTVYLRGETAQGMFVSYKNVLDSLYPDIPFGLAQIGKAFRNEITLGNFIFRTFEFEQMEIEYFIKEKAWEECYEQWKKLMIDWVTGLGVSEDKLRWRRHTDDELSHYSKRTEDIEYDFPFGGYKELYGLAYRTDYDLKQHEKLSGANLKYRDKQTKKEFYPHVIEPTFGVSRTLLVLLLEGYREEKVKGQKRVYLKFKPEIAPYKMAVFPLLANKKELTAKASEVYQQLNNKFYAAWDDHGNIGKRYRRQDEIGTPWCVTIDFDSLKDNTVTVRDRDTMKQERVDISNLEDYFNNKLKKNG